MSKHSSKRIAARQAELARHKKRHIAFAPDLPEQDAGALDGEPAAAAIAGEAGTAQTGGDPGALPEFVARGRGQQRSPSGRSASSKPVAASLYFTSDLKLIGFLSIGMVIALIVLALVIGD